MRPNYESIIAASRTADFWRDITAVAAGVMVGGLVFVAGYLVGASGLPL